MRPMDMMGGKKKPVGADAMGGSDLPDIPPNPDTKPDEPSFQKVKDLLQQAMSTLDDLEAKGPGNSDLGLGVGPGSPPPTGPARPPLGLRG